MTTIEMTFEQIYSKYYVVVLNYINWKINDLHSAEEITNDVFVKVSQHLDNFDSSKSALTSWIRTITNNCIIDYFRKDKSSQYKSVSDFVDSETGNPYFQFTSDVKTEADYDVNKSEDYDRILKAFRGLKPKYRKVATLYFIREKQYTEIAEICNMPLGSVQGMLFRVREMLQSELKGMYNIRKVKVTEVTE